MSATFTIKINGIRTTTVGDMANVIKQVDWTMEGEEAGQKFNLPQTTDLLDPNALSFISLDQITESKIIEWIETTDDRITAIKAHIQYVLDKEVQKSALTSTPLPWASPIPDLAPTVAN